MSCDTFRCRCRCKCYEKCEPKCGGGCRPGYECEAKQECGCEHNLNQGRECEWFENVLKEFYWRGFNDGCRKCGRKENEGGGFGYDGGER